MRVEVVAEPVAARFGDERFGFDTIHVGREESRVEGPYSGPMRLVAAHCGLFAAALGGAIAWSALSRGGAPLPQVSRHWVGLGLGAAIVAAGVTLFAMAAGNWRLCVRLYTGPDRIEWDRRWFGAAWGRREIEATDLRLVLGWISHKVGQRATPGMAVLRAHWAGPDGQPEERTLAVARGGTAAERRLHDAVHAIARLMPPIDSASE